MVYFCGIRKTSHQQLLGMTLKGNTEEYASGNTQHMTTKHTYPEWKEKEPRVFKTLTLTLTTEDTSGMIAHFYMA